MAESEGVPEHRPFKNIWELFKEKHETHASDLHQAAFENDVPLLKKCLDERKVDINFENERGHTSLYIATEKKHKDIVQILLENKAKVQTENCNAIFVAYDVDLIRLLESAGADINSRDSSGNTPLLKAIHMTNYDVVEHYLQRKSDIKICNFEGETCLHFACDVDLSTAIVNLLIENGASINEKDNVGKTPLHHACQISGENLECTTEVIQALVKHGSCLHEHDLKGYCPIHYLMENFHRMDDNEDCFLQIIQILGAESESIQLQTTIGKSVLHIAAENVIPGSALQYLISRGCNPNAQDGQMRTPLHYCAFSRNTLEISRIFISLGSDINTEDKWGNTPLNIGVERKNEAFVQALIQNGVDVNRRNGNGQAAVHIAAVEGSAGILKMLLEAGVSYQTPDNNLSTPLHFAAWGNQPHVCQFLLDNNADPNMQDSLGETPLQTAHFVGALGVLEVLSQHEEDTSAAVSVSFSNHAAKNIQFEELQEILSSESSIKRIETDKGIPAYLREILLTPSVGTTCIDKEYLEIQEEVETLMTNIVSAISKLDGRFRCTLLHAGSTSENTKVRLPDEFDFIFSLEEFADISYSVYKTETETHYYQSSGTKEGSTLYERFANVEPQTKISSISDYMQICLKEGDEYAHFKAFTSSSNIIPCHTMFLIFSQLLEQCVFARDFPLSPRLTVKEVTTHPALHLQWRGSRYKNLNINVDIVPAIRLKDWPERSRRDSVLLTDDFHDIPAVVVPKLPTFLHIDLWRCSFALHETAIFRKLLPSVRNSYIVAKALLSSRVCPLVSFGDYEDELMEYKLLNKIHEADDTEDIVLYESCEEMVPSYVLKMCFLYVVEEKAAESGLESVYMNKESYGQYYKNEADISKNGCHLKYGPAEVMNLSHFDSRFNVDVDIVLEVFRRCEECLKDSFVPSFFNPEHNVLGSRLLEEDLFKVESFVRYIRRLLT